jgi:hypothetical protein
MFSIDIFKRAFFYYMKKTLHMQRNFLLIGVVLPIPYFHKSAASHWNFNLLFYSLGNKFLFAFIVTLLAS